MPVSPTIEPFAIGSRVIGPDEPVYVIGEISANHRGDVDLALQLVDAIADAGADAVKIQTYRADTMTIDADTAWLHVQGGTPWDGRRLFQLYESAATPWEWTPLLISRAKDRGIDLFSSPFDRSAVDHLQQFDVPAYKIASFELTHHELLHKVARTGRPVILSTGMATAEEIDEAVGILQEPGAGPVALLRCNSAYPTPPSEMDLRTIPDMMTRWHVPVGLSDHTLGSAVAIASIALGACIVEKHVTLSREVESPDGAFSLEPGEFASLVSGLRQAEAALGTIRYGPSPSERASLAFRRSLFSLRDIPSGKALNKEDVGIMRPGFGLEPRFLDQVLGRHARQEIPAGTPISWDIIE